MDILIAEDEPISRTILEKTVAKEGHNVHAFEDGLSAFQALQQVNAPKLAILDRQMPGMDGLEICRQMRKQSTSEPPYLILLTGLNRTQDIVEGLNAGANDYLTKPYHREELLARLQAGITIVNLQCALAERVRELEETLAQVKQLQGLLPICCYCKKIRDDKNYWQQVDRYIAAHSEVQFTHGICPECYENVVKPMLAKFINDAEKRKTDGGRK